MKPTSSKKAKKTTLRARAEQKLEKHPARLEELSKQDLQSLVHELGTHQIELEMQNEELRRAQEELESSRRKYQDLYAFAPVGYFTLDAAGVIRETNGAGAALLGAPRGELIGKPLSLFLRTDADRPVLTGHIAAALEKNFAVVCEVAFKRNDGSSASVQLRTLRMAENENDSILLTAATDISERQSAEEKLKTVHQELQRRAYELEAVNRELDAFSFTVSHDLKAPLRSIEGFTDALLEDYAGMLDATGRDYLTRVHSASGRMTQLIDSLLQMARLTGGELHERVVNLSSLAQIASSNLRKQDPGRGVEFAIAQGITARADQDSMTIVLQNLFDNAWKFTGGHPSAKIEFGLVIMDEKIVYFVRDDGAGFDMQYADKLFLPFIRLHRESEFPGLGIGLAVANRIIARHGGRLWAHSEVEKGATFFFTLGGDSKRA